MQRFLFAPLVLGLSGLALVEAATLSLSDKGTYTFLTLIVLAHIPALLPVVVHKALIPNTVPHVQKCPEITVVAAILAVWTTGTIKFEFTLGTLVLAFVLLGALGICYVGVRAVTQISNKLQAKVCRPISFPYPSVVGPASKAIFQIRLLVALVSGTSLIVLSQGGILPLWLPVLPSVSAVFVMVIVAITWKSEEAGVREFGEVVSKVLTRQLNKKPTSVAVYHAGTHANQITATIALCERLESIRQPYILILREKAALEALAELHPLHIWQAETLASLSPCVQPSISFVLYAHDTPKNSHFTRNTEYRHVLFLEHTEHENAKSLPNSFAIYTNIVATSEEHAQRLAATASGDIARRVTTIDSSFIRPSAYTNLRPTLSLHVAPQIHANQTPQTALSQNALLELKEAVEHEGRARLQIWFPPAQKAATDNTMRSLFHSMLMSGAVVPACPAPSEPVAVTLHHGSEAQSCARADLLLATQQSDLDAFYATTKPIVWLPKGGCSAPLQNLQLAKESLGETLDELLFEPEANANRPAPPLPERTFHSLTDLLTRPLVPNRETGLTQ